MSNVTYFPLLVSFMRSVLILLICLMLGKAIAWLIDGLLPSSIIGMLVLTLGLTSRLIKLEWVEVGANFLLRWLSLLFIPISVALIDQFDVLAEYGLSILVILFISTLLAMLVAGRLWQWLEKA